MVDKNLFLHDLAIVAVMKNEGPYLREWLDYHLLAGVEHFYMYDNDSPDNQREVVKPYVAAGLVDYLPAPGKAIQFVTYNDAVKRFKFQCRYMAFIDGDEFIFPKVDVGGGYGIVEVADEILSRIPNAGELSLCWQIYGSNGQEKADYSRGVLERFTRRESDDKKELSTCKCIADPRKIQYVDSPHWMRLSEGVVRINEDGSIKTCVPWQIESIHTKKIVVNHYHCKSREEYAVKHIRGDAATVKTGGYGDKLFAHNDRNDVFDDGILRYRAARAKTYRPPDKSRVAERLLNALMINLSPTLIPNTPQEFYRGKLETFLTCRAVASYLKTRIADDAPAKFFEEASLKAIPRAFDRMSLADARLFLHEVPALLKLKYPAVADIRRATLNIIPQLKNVFHLNNLWRDYSELDYLQDLLKE